MAHPFVHVPSVRCRCRRPTADLERERCDAVSWMDPATAGDEVRCTLLYGAVQGTIGTVTDDPITFEIPPRDLAERTSSDAIGSRECRRRIPCLVV